ncbi:MAG: site-2 protease family protein [bacterium]
MDNEILVRILVQLPILMFSVIVHECAHGWAAERCGDDTARVMGRITLNPLPHIDIMGTIILPILFVLTSPFVFGYAKPVPVNPYRFNHPRRDTLLVSISGPASNILLAIICALSLKIIIIMPWLQVDLKMISVQLLSFAVLVNLFLAILNLIPIPPLDGSGIVSSLLPADLAYTYEKIRPYGFVILVVLLFSGVIGMIIMPVLRFFTSFLLGGSLG